MKRYNWLFACLLTLSAAAQEKLIVKGKTPNQYVVYTVPSETTVQNLSNQFGQSVTKLSTYNDLKPNAAIPKGTVVKIPLTQYNLIRIKGDGSSAPVYHILEKKETLSQLSKANKVSIATLRQWNGLKTDAVKTGQPVIIGYMVNARVSEVRTSEPTRAEAVNATAAVTPAAAGTPIYHTLGKKETLYQLSRANKVSIATLREWNGLKSDDVKIGQKLIVGYTSGTGDTKAPEPKNETKKTEETAVAKTDKIPVVNMEEPAAKPAAAANKTTTVSVNKDAQPEPAEKNTAPAATPQTEPATVRTKEVANSAYTAREGDEGYFAVSFSQSSGQEQQFQTGDAATFKTISGWTDRKFYVLINNVPPETIVRITGTNNKSICAKVLGPLQETKEGNGLLLRMSNSAASSLGITDPKFTVRVTYYQ